MTGRPHCPRHAVDITWISKYIGPRKGEPRRLVKTERCATPLAEADSWDDADASRATYIDIPFQLSRALASANRYLTQLMAENHMTGMVPSHGSILMLLAERARPAGMSELARAVGKDPSTVTSLVKKLCRLGYVRTEQSREDRRQTLVSLTPSGRALLPSIDAVGAELADALRRGLSEAELCALREHLVALQTLYQQALESAVRRCAKEVAQDEMTLTDTGGPAECT